MLNRRILRIKAMQALYGYFTSKESLREVALAQLRGKYELDPAVHDFADREVFKERQDLIERVFLDLLQNGQIAERFGLDDSIMEEIKDAVRQYQNNLAAETQTIRKRMLEDTTGVFKTFLKMLLIPGELAFLEKQDEEKNSKAYVKKEEGWHYHLNNSSYIQELDTLPWLVKSSVDKKVSWSAEREILRKWYQEILKKDPAFIEFHQKPSVTSDDVQQLLKYVFKKLLFSHEFIENYWMESDLHWAENRDVLKSMVLKTLKSYDPEREEKYQMAPLASNADEDFKYFENLYKDTLERNELLDETIAKHAKNWDLNRFAAIDIAIIKLALTEMMTCTSIPVKVTINEFIEISKAYSTPKSKQFVNGILDVMANKLTSEGIIRKSGRGLIDNK